MCVSMYVSMYVSIYVSMHKALQANLDESGTELHCPASAEAVSANLSI